MPIVITIKKKNIYFFLKIKINFRKILSNMPLSLKINMLIIIIKNIVSVLFLRIISLQKFNKIKNKKIIQILLKC